MNKKIITLSIVCLLTVLQLANAQKVGVGTQTPAYILTVKDTMGAGAGIGIAHVSDDDSVAIGTYVDDFSAYIQTHTATNLSFATDNAPAQMTLQKITGNLGIGISTPAERLDVNGNVKISGTLRLLGGSPAAGKVLTSDANGLASWQSNITSKVMSVPFAAFTTTGAFISDIEKNQINGAWVGMASGTSNSAKMFAPLTLPDDAVITGVKVVYVNNTASNFTLSLMNDIILGTVVGGGSVANLALPGTSTSVAIATSATLSHPVNNTNGFYALSLSAAAATWPGINAFRLGWVEITYSN